MPFRELLQQLLSYIYDNKRALLSYDLGQACHLRQQFTNYLTYCLSITEKDLFFIPATKVSEIETRFQSLRYETTPSNYDAKPDKYSIEKIIIETPIVFSPDNIAVLGRGIRLQRYWTNTLFDKCWPDINPKYSSEPIRQKIVEALKLLTKMPEDFFPIPAYCWQAKKCDAIKIWLEIFEQVKIWFAPIQTLINIIDSSKNNNNLLDTAIIFIKQLTELTQAKNNIQVADITSLSDTKGYENTIQAQIATDAIIKCAKQHLWFSFFLLYPEKTQGAVDALLNLAENVEEMQNISAGFIANFHRKLGKELTTLLPESQRFDFI